VNTEELKYWLRWNRMPGIGSIRFFKLLEEFGNMKDAWHSPPEQLLPIIGEKTVAALQRLRSWDPERELRLVQQFGFRVICYPEDNYPAPLKKIADPPPVLYTKGYFAHGDDMAVAIVGTRNPTPQGEYIAGELAMNLSHQGLTIVSGMARGIDSEAHRGALAAQGRTIAVLGCGLNIVYPSENGELMEQIAAHGAVISEYPLGTPPLASNFPARNRIISGLSLGVVVVEATQDSGSLITAGFALEQGREVFAVPGNIGNDGSKGPHKLLRQGAKLVEDYRDILAELSIPQLETAEVAVAEADVLNPSEQKIMATMSREPLHIDQILRRAGLAPAELNAVLIQLELKGLVKRFPGQLYLRIK
jgi:DNA processing protein